MNRGSRLCNAVYWLALTIWIGVLIGAFVARKGAMSILPDLGVTIDDFLTFDVNEHGRIAAEKLIEPILTFVDLTQLVAAVLVLTAVVLQSTLFRIPLRSPIGWARVLCLSLAAVLFVARAAFIMPPLNRTMRAYWEAARLAQVEAAGEYRESLDIAQTLALWMLGATLTLLLIAVAITPAALAATEPKNTPQFEPPALLRNTKQP